MRQCSFAACLSLTGPLDAARHPWCSWGLGPMAQRKKQLISEGKLDKHGRPNADTPKEYLRALPDAAAAAPAAVKGEVRIHPPQLSCSGARHEAHSPCTT